MNNVRVPGVAWVILIVVLIATIHENEASIQAAIGIPAFYLDLAVTVLIAILKSLSVGAEQLNQALDIIDRILNKNRVEAAAPKEGMRSSGTTITTPAYVSPGEIPPRPNKLARWLVG